jgi:uncharacterized membrane protein (DUF485 family)
MFRDLSRARNATEFMYAFLIFTLLIIISAFILKFLWNRVIVPHVTFAKPLATLTDALLMSLAISVVRGY